MEAMLLKFGLSALFGLIIGLDRELKKKPLGLKTCLVLSVSSCMLTIVSIESAYQLPMMQHMRSDPLRLAAQIVSGVGFIGAGVILKRSNEVIVGLTTAAMIWAASGIGIAVGAGYYIEAAAALVIILIGVDVLPYLMRVWGPKSLLMREMDVVLTIKSPGPVSGKAADGDPADDGGEFLQRTLHRLSSLSFTIHNMRITSLEQGLYQLQLRIEANDELDVPQVFSVIEKIAGVQQIDVRSY